MSKRHAVVWLWMGWLSCAAVACDDDEPAGDGDAAGEVGDAAGDTTGDTNPETGDDAEPDVSEDPVGDAEPDADPGECQDFDALRRPFFGDLHVHTSFSFDAYLSGNQCNGPVEAFAFARDTEEGLPMAPYDENCQSLRTEGATARLTRPLDFLGVTDHSEFLGEVSICTDPESEDYDSATCTLFRNEQQNPQAGQISFLQWGIDMSLPNPDRLPICGVAGGEGDAQCLAAARDAWSRSQQAANEANDPCDFTAFVAYEYSGAPGLSMTHRNVIFRGEEVPELPVTYYEEPTHSGLWEGLRAACIDSDDIDCDVLAIPHNPNFSNGRQFPAVNDEGEPITADDAELRRALEPVMEIYQHKGSSECTSQFSEDEACGFENVHQAPLCTGSVDDPENCFDDCGEEGGAGGIGNGCVSRYDFMRDVLLRGLLIESEVGVNPFQLGFIASTDTHNSTPGATEEHNWVGHVGVVDGDPPSDAVADDPESGGGDNVDLGPGGLAVVWAEENTRDAIFDALRRRETYGTSGSRIVVRFFGGWDYAANLCDASDLVSQGYGGGVPMGGLLPARGEATAPTFALSAMADPDICPPEQSGCESGLTNSAYLQRIQIIKGWLDGEGNVHELVYDVACANGEPVDGVCPAFDEEALLDDTTCVPDFDAGEPQMCRVWTDPDFDPAEPAFYYARVIEQPTCRWSTFICNDEGVDCSDPENVPEPLYGCCDSPRTTRERAWTSPIWYTP